MLNVFNSPLLAREMSSAHAHPGRVKLIRCAGENRDVQTHPCENVTHATSWSAPLPESFVNEFKATAGIQE